MYVLWLYFAVDIILMYIFAKNNLLLYGYFRSQYYCLHSCIQLRNGSILFQHLQISMFSSHLYIYTNISLYYNFCAWTLNAFYTLIVPCKKIETSNNHFITDIEKYVRINTSQLKEGIRR